MHQSFHCLVYLGDKLITCETFLKHHAKTKKSNNASFSMSKVQVQVKLVKKKTLICMYVRILKTFEIVQLETTAA